VVAVATVDRIQPVVEAKTAHTENAAEGMVASNLAAFEGRIVSKENAAAAAAAERLEDNWRPLEERAENN
jgi:hypothetical protein